MREQLHTPPFFQRRAAAAWLRARGVAPSYSCKGLPRAVESNSTGAALPRRHPGGVQERYLGRRRRRPPRAERSGCRRSRPRRRSSSPRACQGGGGLAPAQADARQEPAPPRAPCLERSVSPQLPPLSAAARSTTRDDARADTRGGSAAPHHARTAQYGGGAPDDHHPSHGPVGAHAHLSSNP
eukprot:COSAG01_NODE_5092_length_4492_cov_324.945595_1_plen_182_part_10